MPGLQGSRSAAPTSDDGVSNTFYQRLHAEATAETGRWNGGAEDDTGSRRKRERNAKVTVYSCASPLAIYGRNRFSLGRRRAVLGTLPKGYPRHRGHREYRDADGKSATENAEQAGAFFSGPRPGGQGIGRAR